MEEPKEVKMNLIESFFFNILPIPWKRAMFDVYLTNHMRQMIRLGERARILTTLRGMGFIGRLTLDVEPLPVEGKATATTK